MKQRDVSYKYTPISLSWLS